MRSPALATRITAPPLYDGDRLFEEIARINQRRAEEE